MSILLTDLTKRFGSNLVVNKVSLEVNDGELFVLLGSSGSGKSTILRLIAGLSAPDSGRIELNGRDVTFLPPQVRGTGFVFQNYSIFRHMTVAENVAFGLRIRKLPLAEQQRRSDELLELVGLAGLGARYADQLSGGQQQRVALARALAYQPAVLLLDEPFGALDVKIRAQLRKSLKDIQRQLKVTTILVTHDQEEAFELADRIGVIERGHLIEVGSPEALYHRPRTEFVAAFIGGGNVLVGREDSGQIKLGSIMLPMPEDAPAHESGAPVRVLFRPETVLLQAKPLSHSNVITLGQGQVVERIFAGSFQRIMLEVEGLQGVRPLAPPPGYGQRATRIEAVQSSQADPADQSAPGHKLWIGLQNYHILAPTGLKVLICSDESVGGKPAVEFGIRLAQATGGPALLLTVVNSGVEADRARERLEALRQDWLAQLPGLETRVRQGERTEQILLEAREGLYEIVILGRGAAESTLGLTARQVLTQAEVPVLLVQTPRPNIERILICTAAGEPGKTDVRFGGRLARRTGAQATALHVYRPQTSPAQRSRIKRHLLRAQASLEALGVKAGIKTEEGLGVERILHEAETGDYDLIVIGAPAPRASQQLLWPDVASSIVAGTTRPVLVVPMME